jgi:Flp pilus assembly protein TadG
MTMRTNLRKNERGAALLETAITIPIILLISVGIFEFGRAYQTWQVLTNAAREGARIAILAEKTDTDVQNIVKKYMQDGGLPKYASATITVERTVPMGPSTASKITIGYPFNFMVLNGVIKLVTPKSSTGSPITMQSVALMRNEG